LQEADKNYKGYMVENSLPNGNTGGAVNNKKSVLKPVSKNFPVIE
jgi:hypothetical protein